MSNSFGFTIYTFPARLADLGFEISVPSDWTVHDLPLEDVDFSNPIAFAPLMVATSPVAVVALTVSARPAYDNGSVRDWVTYLLENNEIQMTAGGPREVGPLEGIMALGRQNQEGTWLDHRFFIFEDGGRLVNVNLMAPESIAGSFEPVWQAVMEYFKLSAPKGQTTPVSYVPPPAEEPQAAPEVEATTQTPAEKPAGFARYALAEDTASLDPDNSVNTNLRESGQGLTPRIKAEDSEARKVTIAAGAIAALVDVPMGWYVMDDGKRTLVFEPTGEVQINLNVIPRFLRSADEILDNLQREADDSYDDPKVLRVSEGGLYGLSIRNIFDNGVEIEQLHLLRDGRNGSTMVRARVTATPGRMVDAANLGELILKSVSFPGFERDPSLPEWWHKAVALEHADRLEEAEKMIVDSVPHIAFAIATADMYRQRMIRLREQHDDQGAHHAWKKAADWACAYAGFATSGGEGAALSLERDQFLKELGPDPGGRD
ncbi:hypothetical protein [Paludibaculum fermentans]|uniref:hypothetical protein n=1 Tax=Paludibaculum fermentans TaxID=1473598 RepID=UPI003EB7E08F